MKKIWYTSSNKVINNPNIKDSIAIVINDNSINISNGGKTYSFQVQFVITDDKFMATNTICGKLDIEACYSDDDKCKFSFTLIKLDDQLKDDNVFPKLLQSLFNQAIFRFSNINNTNVLESILDNETVRFINMSFDDICDGVSVAAEELISQD